MLGFHAIAEFALAEFLIIELLAGAGEIITLPVDDRTVTLEAGLSRSIALSTSPSRITVLPTDDRTEEVI